ncbi:unnamed protein product [Plutella xylostella]|uniref:(diamondback moth) hypothetical protein n=1 Tax=Plutella xylostella TaxID=51655 RepID=A0A8S4DD67_PLUXY|nr:unnamed protein product [Plutella xylostella]
MQIPNPKKISTDMIGPVDPVSNLRRIIFKQPPKESDLEKRYRLLRSEVQEWNQTFWTQHNTRFFQEREAYLKKNLPAGQQNLTADEMSVFYKEFLDKNYKAHTNYNVEWPSQDSSLKRGENSEKTNNLENLSGHNSKGIYIKDDSQVTHTSKIHQQTSQTSSYLPLKETAAECIWTTKNKDGLLEKVFEYGYDSKHDNSGDTRRIRRIREYSVQCDKECQLDYQRLEAVVTQRIRCQNQNFLTGSEAFKNFLENNMNSLNSPKRC